METGIPVYRPLAAVSLMGLMQSCLLVSVPWLIERSGLSAGLWSVLLALGMLLVVFSAPLWGRRADSQGADRLLHRTLGLVVISFLVLVVGLLSLPAGWLLMVVIGLSRLLHGLGAGGVFPSAQRQLLEHQAPARWPMGLAKLQAVNQAGRLAGPAWMALMAGFSVPLALAGVGVLGLMLWLWSRPAPVSKQDRCPQEPGAAPPWSRDWPLYALALVLTVWIGQLQFVLGPFLQRLLFLDGAGATQLVGVYLALAAVVALIAGPLGTRVLLGRARLMTLLWLGSLTVGGLVVGLAQSAMILGVGIALLVTGLALATPWYGGLLRGRWPAAQGQVAGRLSSLHTLGYGAGTLIGGASLEFMPDQALQPFLVLGPAASLCIWLQRRVTVKVKVQVGSAAKPLPDA